MYRLTFLLIVLAAGAVRSKDQRIIGGNDVKIEEYPHQVSIHYSSSGFICGGSIVKVNRVISASHCFMNIPDRVPLKVRAGSTSRRTGGTVHRVASLKKHPQFSRLTLDYDVAVLTLKDPIVVSPSASPIPLVPVNDGSPRLGEMLTLSGWGAVTHASTNMPVNLRAVKIPAADRSRCEKVYSQKTVRVTPRMFCAGGAKEGAYKGDSGGPIINNKKQLVGIVSWGMDGDINGWPGVFTDLTSQPIRSFIDDNIA